ncbi:MAG: DUF3631 domain-containing protein [Casimicrobiaceae bacterium]
MGTADCDRRLGRRRLAATCPRSGCSGVAAYRGRAPGLGIRLLSDLRRLFGDQDAMPTVAILEGLNALEESPWCELGGKPLNSRGLAMRLKRYGVTSRNVRDGVSVPKGYTREDLHDVWQRYLVYRFLKTLTIRPTPDRISSTGKPPGRDSSPEPLARFVA